MRRERFYYGLCMGLLSTTLFLSSCNESDIQENVINESLMNETNIMLQEVLFDFKYELPYDFKVSFEVYKENPLEVKEGQLVKKDILPIITGITNAKGEYNTMRYIGDNVDKVYILSETIGTPLLLAGEISGGKVAPEEVDLNDLFQTTEMTKSITEFNPLMLGSWNSLGKPNYIIKREEPSYSLLKSMSAILKEWWPVSEENRTRADLYVNEDAQIQISMLHSGSLFNNVLGYYTYKGKVGNVNPDNIKEIVAFPRAKVIPFFSNGLKTGDMVQLKYYNESTGKMEDTFPAGTTIGWILRSSGYSLFTNTLNSGLFSFYSYPEWNMESSDDAHTVLFKKDDKIVIGFEDMPNEYYNGFKGDMDCNDVVFTVTSSPENALTSDIVELPDNNDEVANEEESSSLYPFTDLFSVSEDYDFYNSLFVNSHSTVYRTSQEGDDTNYGVITGIHDELIIAKESAMNEYLSTESPATYRTFVKTTIRKATKAEGRTFVKTTIRKMNMTIEEQLEDGLKSASQDVQLQIMNAINSLRSDLENNKSIRVIIDVEFDPVSEEEFHSIIPTAPYSLFIEE